MRLHAELEGRTDHPSRSVCFVVAHTMFREIFASDIRDRVGHHAVVEALEGVWVSIFPHDSYACRISKETHRQAMWQPKRL